MDIKTEKKMDAENKRNTEQKMNMEQFAESIRERVEQQGQFEKVSLRKVLKNNGVMRWGLLLHRGGKNMVPTIYLEPFFEAYEDGAELEEMIGKIVEIYGDAPCESMDMSFIQEFAKVAMRLAKEEFIGQYNSFSLFALRFIEADAGSVVTSDEIQRRYRSFCQNEDCPVLGYTVWPKYLKKTFHCASTTKEVNDGLKKRRVRAYRGICLKEYSENNL